MAKKETTRNMKVRKREPAYFHSWRWLFWRLYPRLLLSVLTYSGDKKNYWFIKMLFFRIIFIFLVFMCVCYMCTGTEDRGGHQVSCPILLHVPVFRKESATQSAPHVSSPHSYGVLGTCGLTWLFTWVPEIWTQVPTLVHMLLHTEPSPPPRNVDKILALT